MPLQRKLKSIEVAQEVLRLAASLNLVYSGYSRDKYLEIDKSLKESGQLLESIRQHLMQQSSEISAIARLAQWGVEPQ